MLQTLSVLATCHTYHSFMALLLLLTWHGHKKLYSISMSMETQLGVCHGAVWHKAAWHGTVGTVITVNTYSTAGPIWHNSRCLVGCRMRKNNVVDKIWRVRYGAV